MVEAEAEEGEPVLLSAVLEQWPLVVSDFASEYGIQLLLVKNVMPWREFLTYLVGLMACNSRVARHFTPKKPS